MQPAQLLIIACGAIAREVSAVARSNGWQNIKISQIPAELHNRPEQIPAAVEKRLQDFAGEYKHVFVGFADCGTGGRLDAVLKKYEVQRLHGAHCYEFFAGKDVFEKLSEDEIGTFYLTDYLVKNFNRIMIKGLGLDKYPELFETYFQHYKKLVYLAQTENEQWKKDAEQYAKDFGFDYEYRLVGTGSLNYVFEEIDIEPLV